jgi:hypothetical protein
MKHSAQQLVPTDCYFKDEDGLISELPLDRDNYIDFELNLYGLNACCSFLNMNVFPFGIICCPFLVAEYFICGRYNIEDLVNAKHVCLTDDGVIYIVEKHKSRCRCFCMDVGKMSTLLSYEKITDVSVQEPAGAEWCGLIPRILYTVTIQTAGSPLVIAGLKNPLEFKKEVMRIKKEKELKPMMYNQPMMYAQQAGPPQMSAQQAGPPQMYIQQAGPPQMYAQQDGQPQMYAQQPGQPQMYAQQAGQPQMYAQQAGQPQMYAQQAGQPTNVHVPQMVYAQPVPMEMDRGSEVNKM